jgi:hypothetical protein
VDIPVEPVKVAAAANLRVKFFVYVMAAHSTTVTVAELHWHFLLVC